MTKHTEGPWSVADHDQGDQDDGWRTVMARGRIVANINPESFCGVEGGFVDMPADANARLIAAAPEMLLALQTIARKTWHRGTAMLHEEEMILVTQAIARATGESK